MKKKFPLLLTVVIAAVGISLVSCHKSPLTPPSKENILPNATAGEDQIINLPKDNTVLDGSQSTDADGYIVSFEWTQVTGPRKAEIQDAHAMQSVVNYLAEGVYYFELKVIDDAGGIAKDDMVVRICK